MKINSLLALLMLIGTICFAQDMNNVQYPEMYKTPVRKEIKLPEILGYQLLKCDFHMHTIFSDGIVWPDFRIDEAWEEGLDAIAISDHLENQPSRKYISGDHNASYQLALKHANEKKILLIQATEITRSMPPGHLNALFISDANLLIKPNPVEVLDEAKKQGAFIFWNHPGWKAQQPDTCRWMPMHQELYEKGLINGIEVFNEMEYYPIALDWCLDKKLTVICNSDIHGITSQFYDTENGHRPMTLVLVRDRTIDCIKEALKDNRTIAFFNNKLAGTEEFLKAFFQASVKVKPIGSTNGQKRELFVLTNNSDIPFDLITKKGDSIYIPAGKTVEIALNHADSKEITVKNLFTGARSYLKIDLQ
jgi:hypothetical protein